MSCSQIKIVTLHNFHAAPCAEPLVGELFQGMLLMKKQGYGPEYPEFFMPYDSSDFIGTHHLFCVTEGAKLFPVAGFRQVLLSDCDNYRIAPPLLSLVEETGQRRHIQALRSIVADARAAGRELISSGGFTILPRYRANREFAALVRELVIALMCDDHWAHGDAILIGGGVVRFKTDRLWEKAGYLPLKDGEEALPAVGVATANQEPLVLMKFESPSAWAAQCHEAHRALLLSRLTIGAVADRGDACSVA